MHRLQGKTAGPEISAINHGGVYTALSLRGPVFIQGRPACVQIPAMWAFTKALGVVARGVPPRYNQSQKDL